MCGRRALGTVRHSSILSARRFALTGTGRTPRAGFPLPQGPTQRAAWPPTPGGAAAKFWGEGTRQGRASLASPSWPPPHPPRPSPPTHRPSAPAPHVPCHSALPLLPWPREQVQTPPPTLLEAGTGDEGLLQAGRTPRPGHWPPWAPVSSRVKRPPQRASRGLGGAIRTLVTWHAEGARPRQASAWMISGLDTRHNRRAGGRLFLGVPETGQPNALSLTSVDSGRTAPPRVCPPAPC